MFTLYDGTIHNNESLRPVLNTICYKVNSHNAVIETNYYMLVNILVHKGKYDSYVLRSLKTGKTISAKKIAIFNEDNKNAMHFKAMENNDRKAFYKLSLNVEKLVLLHENYLIKKTTKTVINNNVITTIENYITVDTYVNMVVENAHCINASIHKNITDIGYLPQEITIRFNAHSYKHTYFEFIFDK